MTLNDADVAHCWNRMKQGYSLAQVAAGRDLRASELDLLIWQWRGRRVVSTAKAVPFDPRALRRLHAPLD